MDKQLRLLAAAIVVESKLPKQAKIQMLNFIKEDATDAQIKALLMDGEIVKLDEQSEKIVNDRFASTETYNKFFHMAEKYMSTLKRKTKLDLAKASHSE